MTLRKRLALVVGAYLAILVVGGLLITVTLRAWTRELDERRVLLIASERAASLRGAYLDQETSVRGFVITGDETFLEPYVAGQERAGGLASDLRRSLAGVDGRPELVDATVAAAEAWRAETALPAIEARRAANSSNAEVVLSEDGRLMFDALRDELTVLDNDINERAEHATNQARDARVELVVAISIVVGGVVVLTAAAALFLRRWVIRPLAAIVSASAGVTQGDVVTIASSGPRELRELAATIDTMQTTIRKQRDVAIVAREAVEQNAVLALQLRDELAHDVGDYPEGWTVAAGLRPAEGLVAGDCYDVSLLSPTLIGVVVLDIAGHGALAAVSAFRCKELLKVALRNGLDPGGALVWLAAQDLGLEDSFFTAFVATIDTRSALCRYANAGHPPAILVTDDGAVQTLDPTGALFGQARQGWETAELVIHDGAVLAVFTDGLLEGRNSERQFYGEDRLISILADMDCRDAQPLVDRVLTDHSLFSSGRVADDVTLVVFCHNRGPDDTAGDRERGRAEALPLPN